MKTVAVIGASGFLGQAVVERLSNAEGYKVRAVVHSTGNAWALASAGVPLHFADINSPNSIKSVLSGCTHVVNCSRGGLDVMKTGFSSLLEQARSNGIERLVHISSVAIYGSQTTCNVLTEDADLAPTTDYGKLKLLQDQQVEKARKKGLEAVILCPPNISGVGSSYLSDAYSTLVSGEFPLVEDGIKPLELVDVRNLAEAVWLGLSRPLPSHTRYFITDMEQRNWSDLVTSFERNLQENLEVQHVSLASLPKINAPSSETQKASLWQAMKHLVSSDVRFALRENELLDKFDHRIRSLVAKLPSTIEDKLRLSIEGTLPVPAVDPWLGIHKRYCEQQLRSVRYSCVNAEKELGYRPVVTFDASIRDFVKWRVNKKFFGYYADMLRELDI